MDEESYEIVVEKEDINSPYLYTSDPSDMLPKTRRLRRNEVTRLFEKGKIIHSPYFVLKKLQNRAHESRFCITFSKKCSVNAVQRNRKRRQVYEAIRKNDEILTQNIDIAFIIKPQLLNETNKKIEPIVKTTLSLLEKHG